jgi:hypothetical protein
VVISPAVVEEEECLVVISPAVVEEEECLVVISPAVVEEEECLTQGRTGSRRGRMDRSGPADRHIPRTSRAELMHRIVSCPPPFLDGCGGCEALRFGVITNARWLV